MSSDTPSDTSIAFGLDARDPAAAGEARDRARQHFVFDEDDVATEHLIVLTEVVQNALNAHSHAGIDQPVLVSMSAEPPVWSVRDHADGFDVADVLARPMPRPTQTTGRGLHIARTLVPQLSIESGPDGTEVRIPLTGGRWIRRSST